MARAVRSGELRHVVRIEREVRTRNPTTLVESVAWQTLYDNVPAAIAPLSAREFVSSGAKQNGVTTRIKIRYADGIDGAMRIVHEDDGGRIYNIIQVLPDETLRHYLTLVCETGVSGGQ